MRFIKPTTLLTILAFLVLISTASFAADDKLIIGKKGEIAIDQPTRFGTLVLPKGQYRIEHRVVGSEHLLHFTELTTRPGTFGALAEKHSFPDVKCQTEMLHHKVQDNTIYLRTADGERIVTRVEIRGETVAHVF